MSDFTKYPGAEKPQYQRVFHLSDSFLLHLNKKFDFGQYKFLVRARTNLPKENVFLELFIDGYSVCKFTIDSVNFKEYECKNELYQGHNEIYYLMETSSKKSPTITVTDLKIYHYQGDWIIFPPRSGPRRFPEMFPQMSPEQIETSCKQTDPQKKEGCINFIKKRMRE